MSASLDPSTEPPRKTGHMLFIDALRGVASLWVVLRHTFGGYTTQSGLEHLPFRLLVRACQLGSIRVSLFLVLSGFSLFVSLARRSELRDMGLNIADFYKRRARRILPPYYAALLISALLVIVQQHLQHLAPEPFLLVFRGKKDLLLHLTMLYNLNGHTFGSVNSVFWSLALEVDLYLVFPILVWLAARHGLRGFLIPTFLLGVIWQTLVWHRFGFTFHWAWPVAASYQALPGRAFEFAAGMAAAYLVVRPRPGQHRIAAILIGVLLLPALFYVVHISRFGPLLDQMWGIIFASMVVLLARIDNAHFVRRRLARALVWVGTISYSLYLIHKPIIELTTPAALHLPGGEAVAAAVGFARVPLLIALAYLFHLAFERPFMTKPAPRTEKHVLAPTIAVPAV